MDREPIVPVVECLRCRVDINAKEQWFRGKKAAKLMKRLMRTEVEMENQFLRGSTVTSIHRGRKDYMNFAEGHHLPPLAATDGQMTAYIAHSLHYRGDGLKIIDSSTLQNYVTAQGSYTKALRRALRAPSLYNPAKSERVRMLMKVARDEYKKPSKAMRPWLITEVKRMLKKGFHNTRSGKHRRLCLWFHTLGVLRQTAGSILRVFFRINRKGKIRWKSKSHISVRKADGVKYIEVMVDVDKNVKKWKLRRACIPHHVHNLGIYPVKELEAYIRESGVKSGDYLMAAPAPKGRGNRLRQNPYTNQVSAFRSAYRRAYPSATSDDAKKYGTTSCRKSLAQWLWDDGNAKRVIADQGGWAIRTDAVDIYFKTGRTKLLYAVANAGTKHLKIKKKLRRV